MSTQQSFSPKHIQFRLSDEALWQRLEDAAVAASRSPNQVAKQLVIDALGSSSEQGLEDAMPDDTSRSSREVSSVSLPQILELLEHIADTQARLLEFVCQSPVTSASSEADSVAMQSILDAVDSVREAVSASGGQVNHNLILMFKYLGVAMLMLYQPDSELPKMEAIINEQIRKFSRE